MRKHIPTKMMTATVMGRFISLRRTNLDISNDARYNSKVVVFVLV
jgi:hypothetical protein